MARARNIKPGIFMNELLGTADPLLSILFMGLWCLADKAGRLEDRPSRIKVEIFPYRTGVDVDEMLYKLQQMGFIIRYKAQDERYIQVIAFCKHQKPHHTEKDSLIPPCDSKCLIIKGAEDLTVKGTLQNCKSTVVERSDLLIPDSLIPDSGFTDSLIAMNEKNTRSSLTQDAQMQAFNVFWSLYPPRPGANKTQAWRAWQARIKAGATPQEMQAGADRYRRYCKAMRVEDRFIKHASTFLGPDLHYQLPWKSTGQGSYIDRLTGRRPDPEDGEIIDV